VKKNKTTSKQPVTTKKNQTSKLSFYELIENFCLKNTNIILIGSIALSLIFSFLLFDPDVSVGGDDSGYIKAAYDFSKDVAFPSWHGSFYSILLSVFISIFGVKIVALKIVSVLFFAASLFFIQKIFLKITNHTISSLVLIFTATSYLLNNYASTTYSEPFFFFFQSLYIYLFYNYFLKIQGEKETFKNSWKDTLILGIITYLLIETRSVSIAVFGVTIVYLLIEKKYLNTLLYFGFTACTSMVYGLYKSIFWKTTSIGIGRQLNDMLLKNPYKPQLGNEDFMGILQRLWDNSELYLSKHLMRMFGFKSFDSLAVSPTLTIFIYLIFIAAIIISIAKNKKLTFIILFLVGMIGVSFISLGKLWDQERLIMIYFPFIVGILAYSIYSIFGKNKKTDSQIVPLIIFGAVFILVFGQTISKIGKNNVKHRFTSGKYESYSPDWRNYMLASKFAAENLPDSAVVVCRKAEMSWIAGEGKNIFSGVYKLMGNEPDSVFNELKKRKATHVIMGNLRVDPRKKTDKTISTIRNSLSYLNYKYPACLTLVKEFGDDEKAYLFSFDFSAEMEREKYIKNVDNALEVNPRNANLAIIKANYFTAKKDYDSALKCLDVAIRNNQSATLYFNRGVLYYTINEHQKGIQDFNKVLELDGKKYPEAWVNIAVGYFNLQDYGNAIKYMQEAKKNGFNGDTKQLEFAISRLPH
jgi:hypothetical protein